MYVISVLYSVYVCGYINRSKRCAGHTRMSVVEKRSKACLDPLKLLAGELDK